jgi:hypothetical protein
MDKGGIEMDQNRLNEAERTRIMSILGEPRTAETEGRALSIFFKRAPYAREREDMASVRSLAPEIVLGIMGQMSQLATASAADVEAALDSLEIKG